MSQTELISIQDQIQDIQNELIANSAGVGNLIMICIPKALAYSDKSPLYLSWHHGYHLEISSESSLEEVVEFLQNGKVKQAQEKLEKNAYGDVPQARLLAHQLKPEHGIKIFRINAIPKEVRNKCRIRIA